MCSIDLYVVLSLSIYIYTYRDVCSTETPNINLKARLSLYILAGCYMLVYPFGSCYTDVFAAYVYK